MRTFQKYLKMKKLELKEKTVEKQMLHASYMRESALNEIEHFALFEAQLLYKAIYGREPNYAEDEELCICTGDLKRNVSINVATETDYGKCYELVEIAEIIVSIDRTIIVRNEDGDEWDDSELSFDEIVNIVDAIQEAYNEWVKL